MRVLLSTNRNKYDSRYFILNEGSSVPSIPNKIRWPCCELMYPQKTKPDTAKNTSSLFTRIRRKWEWQFSAHLDPKQNKAYIAKFDAHTVVKIRAVVFWDMTPCCLGVW